MFRTPALVAMPCAERLQCLRPPRPELAVTAEADDEGFEPGGDDDGGRVVPGVVHRTSHASASRLARTFRQYDSGTVSRSRESMAWWNHSSGIASSSAAVGVWPSHAGPRSTLGLGVVVMGLPVGGGSARPDGL